MQPRRNAAFKPARSHDWTLERIAQLGRQEIEQLAANAEALGETAVAELCAQALKSLPARRRGGASRAAPAVRARHLIPRGKAFQARGVYLDDARTSWGGVRKSDGAVVMSLWAGAVESGEGGCRHLLWAPNIDGSRPWSDMPGGRERLEHCKLALQRGGAEGLLVYGEALEGHLPEEKARSVRGVDPETLVHFKIERRGEEYWAVWGAKSTPEAM